MRRLRTMTSRRLSVLVGVVAALAIGGGIAQAALSAAEQTPAPKPLDRALLDASRAPAVKGIEARVTFANNLLPSGTLPEGTGSPLAAGAEGRLWLRDDGRARLELQSDAGDAQIVVDEERVSVIDSASNTVYRMTLPAEPKAEREKQRGGQPTLAGIRTALDRLTRAWTVSGARPTNTAGEPSYTVRLSPKDDGGLLGAAEVAWDAVRGVPLRAAVYAQGKADPVLELKADEIDYRSISLADVQVNAPAGARVVDVNPRMKDAGGKPVDVEGVEAVSKRLDFALAAPRELAGLPRTGVRLLAAEGKAGAVVTYGEGLGAIVVFQQRAGADRGAGGLPLQLPQVNIDGATGTELATALGTVVTFERAGIRYTVLGSVPPVAAENAARGLK